MGIAPPTPDWAKSGSAKAPRYGENQPMGPHTSTTVNPDGTWSSSTRYWDPRTQTYRTGGGYTNNMKMPDFSAMLGGIGSAATEAWTPPAPVTGPPVADRTAAEAAAYGRAKDQIGLSTAGALKSLRNAMTARGIGGSGVEAHGTTGVVQTGLGQLGEVSRDQAIQALARAAQVEDRNYAGDITQRGQDISGEASRYGANLSATNSRLALLPAILNLYRSLIPQPPAMPGY